MTLLQCHVFANPTKIYCNVLSFGLVQCCEVFAKPEFQTVGKLVSVAKAKLNEEKILYFHRLVVAMSVHMSYVCRILSPSHGIFFEASHWPSYHMISLRPLNGQPSFITKLSPPMVVLVGDGGGCSYYYLFF